jgi:hypothetical protein
VLGRSIQSVVGQRADLDINENLFKIQMLNTLYKQLDHTALAKK